MDSFFSYISNLHPNIIFTRETEQNNNISFLDISITRQFDNTLATSVYHKPTFTGPYLEWDSFVPKAYKRGLVTCLVAVPFAFAHVLTALMQRLISSNQFLSKMATLLTLYKTV